VAALVALEGGRLSLRHLAASYLFLPWPRIGAERHFFPVLGVGWTLNYEAFFYALFALSLLAPARLRLAVLTSLFTSFAALGFLIDSDIGAARFYTQPLILQFLAGAWIGHVWKHRTSLAWPLLGCAFAVVLLAIPALLHFREAIWRGLWAVLTLLAVLAAHRSFPTRRRFAFGLLLGDASYSLYLWHPLVLLALAAAGPPGWVFLAVGIPLSIAAGLLSYRFFERPLLRYFRRQRRKHEGVAPSA
jgi:exopolysaccharide production protein ExoZ